MKSTAVTLAMATYAAALGVASTDSDDAASSSSNGQMLLGSANPMARGAPAGGYGGGAAPTCPRGSSWGNAGPYCLTGDIWYCTQPGAPAVRRQEDCNGNGCKIAPPGRADFCNDPAPAPTPIPAQKCSTTGKPACPGCPPTTCSRGEECRPTGMPGCNENGGNLCGTCQAPAPTPMPAQECSLTGKGSCPGCPPTSCMKSNEQCVPKGMPGCNENGSMLCGTCQEVQKCSTTGKAPCTGCPPTNCRYPQQCKSSGMPGCSENGGNLCGTCQ